MREKAVLTIKESEDGTRLTYYAGETKIESLREIEIDGFNFRVKPKIVPVYNEKFDTDNEEAQTLYSVEWDGATIPLHSIEDEILAAYYTVRVPRT